MTVHPRPEPLSLDWSPFGQSFVEDAQAALGFPLILLSRFDVAGRRSVGVAWGGLALQGVQRALRLMARMVPSYDALRAVIVVDHNPLMQQVFAGETVSASIEDFCRGIVPAPTGRIAGQVAGAAHGLALPLCLDGRVLGSLTCFQRHPIFSDAQLRTAQAFARQVALSIHNAELLAEQRRSAAALEAARRLVSEAEERTRRDISEFLHSHVQSRLLVAELRLAEIEGNGEAMQRRLEQVRAELEDLREQDVRHGVAPTGHWVSFPVVVIHGLLRWRVMRHQPPGDSPHSMQKMALSISRIGHLRGRWAAQPAASLQG